MSNSSLVSYTQISPNRTSPRNHAIDTITIHCMAGQLTVQGCGSIFAKPSSCASSNYGIGKDGTIAMYVEEKDRSWCSSNAANDHRAVTIEVASDSFAPYKVTDAAYNSLIKLLVDICKRNKIKKLLWQGNPALIGQVSKQNMTVHRWFKNKACPGDYLYNRHGEIAATVNKKLGASTTSSAPVISTIPEAESANFAVKITTNVLNIRSGPGTKYAQVGTVTKGKTVTIVETSNGWGKLKSGAGWISLNEKYIKKVSSVSKTASKVAKTVKKVTLPSYKVGKEYKLTDEMNVRTGPGTNYSKKKYYQLTTGGQKADKDKDGALDKGTVITCQQTKAINGDEVWMRCPSGWIAAYYKGSANVK